MLKNVVDWPAAFVTGTERNHPPADFHSVQMLLALVLETRVLCVLSAHQCSFPVQQRDVDAVCTTGSLYSQVQTKTKPVEGTVQDARPRVPPTLHPSDSEMAEWREAQVGREKRLENEEGPALLPALLPAPHWINHWASLGLGSSLTSN